MVYPDDAGDRQYPVGASGVIAAKEAGFILPLQLRYSAGGAIMHIDGMSSSCAAEIVSSHVSRHREAVLYRPSSFFALPEAPFATPLATRPKSFGTSTYLNELRAPRRKVT